MFSRQKVISHLALWSLIAAGDFLAFIFFPAGLAFNMNFDRWFIIAPLLAFFFYHLSSALYRHFQFSPFPQKAAMAIRKGVYGKSAHPTCTTLAIFNWIIFFYYPDIRIFLSAIWISAIISFWIRAEKSFFRGDRFNLNLRNIEPA